MKRISPSCWLNLLALALCLIVSAGCSKASKARRVLASAERDFQAQNYDKAEIEYESVLRLSQRDPRAIRQLGFLYYEEGLSRKALPYFQMALKQNTNDTEVQLKMAELYASVGGLRQAVELLGSVLRADPGNGDALVLSARVAPTNGLASLGARLETEIREGGPGAAACQVALGWIDLRTLKLDEAGAKFQLATNSDPKLASAYLGRAALCAMLRETNGVGEALKMAAERSPVRSPIQINYAEFELKNGPTNEAKEMVRGLTNKAPDYIPARIFLMKLAFDNREYDDCKSATDGILARDNLNYEAMLQLGELAMIQRDGPKALAAFQRLDGMYKKVPLVKYDLAEAYLLNNEKQKAASSLREALDLNPDLPAAVRLLAQLDYRLDNGSDAVSLLSKLIDKHPEDAQAQLALAEIYLEQKRPERALAMYQKMATNFPNNPEILRRLGVVYFNQGDIRNARAYFEQSLKQAPNFLAALEEMNDLDIYEKHYAEAHKRVEGFMENNPKVAGPCWMLQGDVYWKEGKTDQAVSAYSKAIELSTNLPAAYLKLAQLYVDSHQEKQALDQLDALVAKQTNNIPALLQIGVIHQTAGRYQQARDAYEKVLTVDSNSFSALNNLAYVDAEYLTNLDEAFQLATRANLLHLDNGGAADTLGWILFKKHEYARALSLLQEGADKQSDDPEVQMHLGMDYYMMGEEKPARDWLRKALASNKEFPDKALAQRSLEVLNIDPATATPEAVQHLTTMVQEDPQDSVPLSRLAAIQEQHGETQKATDSLQKLLSINAQNWSAMIRLSRLYANQPDGLRQALEWAKKAHNLAPPDDGSASALLGELVYRSGDYAWSLSLLEDAARHLPDQPSSSYYLALAYYATGHAEEADAAMQKTVGEGDFPNLEQAKQFIAMRAAVKEPAQAPASSARVEEILAKDPNYVPALMVSAWLAERQGAADKAIGTCQKVLGIYPAFAPAMRQLAMLYSHSEKRSDLDQAYNWGEKARGNLHDDLELTKTLGLVAYRRNDYKGSLPLLEEYTQKSRDDGEAFYYLGMDYYKLKQTSQCKVALKHAQDLGYTGPVGGDVKTILNKLKVEPVGGASGAAKDASPRI